jgi:Tol biopolymer transport system component
MHWIGQFSWVLRTDLSAIICCHMAEVAPTTADAVRQELERVLQSKAFRNAEALSRLLRFVVNRSLDGDAESLKEYTLGSQVLERGGNFDPQTDPIVRVQAGRLRSKLQEYYGAEGKDDPVRIALPKGGYVPEFRSALEPHSPSGPDEPPKRRLSRTHLVWASAMALTVAIAAWLIVFRREVRPPGTVIRATVSAPPGSAIMTFAISPDSRLLAVILTHGGKTQIGLRAMDALEPRMIAGTEGVPPGSVPFWSPDSRFLGFFTHGELKKLDTTTGLVQTICKAPQGMAGSWNRSGLIVFAPGIQDPLFRVSDSGSVPVQVTKFELNRQDESHRWPWFLPDGRRFLFYIRASLPENSGVYLGDLDGRAPWKILTIDSGAVYVSTGHLAFVRQGTLYAQRFDVGSVRFLGNPIPLSPLAPNIRTRWGRFAISGPGVLVIDPRQVPNQERDLLWVDHIGRTVRSMGRIGVSQDISLAANGVLVAYDHPGPPTGAADVWVYDARRGASRRITLPPATSSVPVLSRDGKQVAFSSSSGGPYDLLVKDLTSSADLKLLVHSDDSKYATDWSPDGQYLLFDRADRNGKMSIWLLPVAAGGKPSLWQYDASLGQFSPDGRFIAYASVQSGVKEVVVRQFSPSGAQWQVSNGGGSKPRWSGDGSRLFYVARDLRLMMVRVSMPHGTFESGTPEGLFETTFSFDDERVPYAVGRDGKEVLTLSLPDPPDPSPITLVLNWTSLLPDRN